MKKTIVLLALMMMGLGIGHAQNNTPQHGWHSYCGGEFNNAIGGGIPFVAAISYPADMLADYAGTCITKVAIFSDTLYNAVGGRYTCSVYVGGQPHLGGMLVSTKTFDVPQSLNDWAEFDLDAPVWVTGDAEIWVVWVCDQQLSSFPMGVCEGNDPSGNGHWNWNMVLNEWYPSSYGDWTVKTYFNWDGPQPQLQDVYVSGNQSYTGKIFKNNTLLYDLTDSINLQLRGIQVAEDGTVYGAGYAYDDSVVQGRVWMNDSCVFTSDTNTYFHHITLNGDEWIAAGYNNIWQNGELLYSYTHDEGDCHIHSLTVNTTTGDIYAGGAISFFSDSLYRASIWKNDSLLWLADSSSSIESICFDGENLFASGFMVENDSLSYGVILQNDSIIYQIENTNFGCIAAFDGSLYWSGISMTDTVVCIWQDGEVLHALPEISGIGNLVVNESGVYYTDAQTVYKDGEVLYQPECIISGLVVKPASPQPEYTITVESANPEWGSVSGGGIFTEGSQTTLYGIPALGCEFIGWNDSITDNPRTITVTQDSTFVAHFGRIEYTVNVVSDHPAWGTVTGGGTYYYGDTIVISATPNLGFAFAGWTDGVYTNPRTVVVTQDRTFTARFEIRQCVITTNVTPEGAGTVNGGGSYNYGETIHLVAHSNTGYTFEMWDDGNITNPRSVFVEGDATYTAVFTPLQYEITVEADPAEGGTVTGSGTYNYGSTATITATANEHYMFICWHDGIVTNPRNVNVSGNATYKALFHLNGTPQYTITVLANDPSLGTVSGSGTYPENTTIEISATPNNGVVFNGWNDGNTDNPRSVTVTENMTFTAIFSEIPTYTITVSSADPQAGSTYGSGTYAANTVINIGAVPNEGFHFSGWQDGDMNNPRTITVTENAEYIASFSETPVQTYTVTVYYDDAQGFILGAGTYPAGATASIAAIAADGFVFKKWSDNTDDNPKVVVVDHDITLAAFFESNDVDENGFENVSLYPNPANDKLHIDGLEGEHEAQIYNAFGLLVKTATLHDNDEVNIDELNAGLYFIRIDGHTMKFVKE